MIVEPELARMTVHDLQQRYARTWVNYDGRAVQIHDFASLDGRPVIRFAGGGLIRGDGIENLTLFDHTKLCVARPEAKWYWYGETPIYCYYKPVRQFKRGLHGENVAVFNPNHREFVFDHHVAQAMLRNTSTPVSLGNIAGEERRHAILNNYLAMNQSTLYCCTKKVGVLEGYRVPVLFDTRWEQEFRDLGFKTIKFDLTKKKPEPTKKKKTLDEFHLVIDEARPIEVEAMEIPPELDDDVEDEAETELQELEEEITRRDNIVREWQRRRDGVTPATPAGTVTAINTILANAQRDLRDAIARRDAHNAQRANPNGF